MTVEFNRETSFGWMINVVAHHASKKFDSALKKHGLTIALWPTMMCLWEEEGINQREIADKSKVENSTTTRTLDKLEKLGLVERRNDPNNRRSFRIYLTEDGRNLKEKLLPVPMTVNQDLLSALSADEQQQILLLLQKMVKEI